MRCLGHFLKIYILIVEISVWIWIWLLSNCTAMACWWWLISFDLQIHSKCPTLLHLLDVYFVYIHFLCACWHHRNCIHFGCYYCCFWLCWYVSLSSKFWFCFQMVLLEWFNGDGNETHLILADLIFLKLSLLISVLWLMNDPALVPLIVFVILCLMWGLTQ